MFSAIATLLSWVLCRPTRNPPPVAAPRKWPSSLNTTAQNFRLMKLLHQVFVVDEDGAIWSVETRQCPFTGIIMRQTRRVSA